MTYRKPDPDIQADRQRAEARIDALAAEGRRKRAELDAARRAETPGADATAKAAAERLQGRIEAGTPGRGCAILAACVVALVVSVIWGRDLGLPAAAIVALVVCAVGVAAGVRAARARWSRTLVPRARAHIAALPFPVRGYFETLGCETELDVIATHLLFQSDKHVPEPRTVADVLGRIAPDVVITESDEAMRRALFSEKSARTCLASAERGIRIYRRMKPNYGTFTYRADTRWTVMQKDMSEIFPWMRDLVDEVIVPLHARFPIESVDFEALE